MNKMMIDRATVQQVLDALTDVADNCEESHKTVAAIAALRESIEADQQPEAHRLAYPGGGAALFDKLWHLTFNCVTAHAGNRVRTDLLPMQEMREFLEHLCCIVDSPAGDPVAQARIAELESEAVGYQAELAGYEHTIGHLSALVEELRAQQTASVEHLDRIIVWQGERLKKAKSMLSADGFGVPLDPLLDEINEYLDAVNTEPTAKTVEIDRIKTERVPCWKHGDDPKSGCAWCEKHSKTPESGEIKTGMEPLAYFIGGGLFGNEMQDWEILPEHGPCDKLDEAAYSAGKEVKIPLYAEQKMELYGWTVTGHIGVFIGEYAQQDAEAVARRCGGTSRAFALYREAENP